MKRIPFPAILVAACALAAPALNAATPEKDHVAVGGTLGLYVPYESDYRLGGDVQATFDYYLKRRVSLRGTAGYLFSESKSFDNPSATAGYLLGSAVYNWELGSIHPYALGGVGVYAISPAFGGSTVRVGAHAGGGADFFLNRRTAVAAEGVFHFVGSVEDQKQGFFALNGGIRYFF